MKLKLLITLLTLSTIITAQNVPTITYIWEKLPDAQKEQVIKRDPNIVERLKYEDNVEYIVHDFRLVWETCYHCKGQGHIIHRSKGAYVKQEATSTGLKSRSRGVYDGDRGRDLRRVTSGHTGKVIGIGKSKIVKCNYCNGQRGHSRRIKRPIRKIIIKSENK